MWILKRAFQTLGKEASLSYSELHPTLYITANLANERPIDARVQSWKDCIRYITPNTLLLGRASQSGDWKTSNFFQISIQKTQNNAVRGVPVLEELEPTSWSQLICQKQMAYWTEECCHWRCCLAVWPKCTKTAIQVGWARQNEYWWQKHCERHQYQDLPKLLCPCLESSESWNSCKEKGENTSYHPSQGRQVTNRLTTRRGADRESTVAGGWREKHQVFL